MKDMTAEGDILMTDTIINDFILTDIAKDYAKEIHGQTSNMDEAYDITHQFADSCEWVIYTYKAHMLCLNCNTDNGQAFVDDCCSGVSMFYDKLAMTLAYGELHSRIISELTDLFKE